MRGSVLWKGIQAYNTDPALSLGMGAVPKAYIMQ